VNEHLSARIALLDAQIVDCDRLPVGRVDDLEVRFPGVGQTPELGPILTGSQALGERLGGVLGRWMSSISMRLRAPVSSPAPASIDIALVVEAEPLIRLSVPADELEGVAGLERWLASRVVERLPGTGHATE
jgi:hypothetical protein